MARIQVAHPRGPGRDFQVEQRGETVLQAVAAEDGVETSTELRQRRTLRGQRAQRRLELGHEERRPQPFAGDISQSDAHPSRSQVEVIHEIASDIVRGARGVPERPPCQSRVAARQQRQLHLAGNLDLVARQKLVLELEHQHEEQEPEGRGSQIHRQVQTAELEAAADQQHQE